MYNDDDGNSTAVHFNYSFHKNTADDCADNCHNTT